MTKEQALALFEALSEELFPLFAQALGGRRPEIRVREMKTRWGSCTPSKGRITLNLRLAEYPRETARYVVAHEYAHFVRADHSPAFWAEVARAVPDWRAQRARLRGAP